MYPDLNSGKNSVKKPYVPWAAIEGNTALPGHICIDIVSEKVFKKGKREAIRRYYSTSHTDDFFNETIPFLMSDALNMSCAICVGRAFVIWMRS